MSGTASAPVQALAIVVGPGPSDDGERVESSNSIAATATVFAQYTSGVVVASGPDQSGDVPSAVQNSPDASAGVVTVVEGTEFYGQISVPLSLANALNGNVGHYGPGDGRSLIPTLGG